MKDQKYIEFLNTQLAIIQLTEDIIGELEEQELHGTEAFMEYIKGIRDILTDIKEDDTEEIRQMKKNSYIDTSNIKEEIFNLKIFYLSAIEKLEER